MRVKGWQVIASEYEAEREIYSWRWSVAATQHDVDFMVKDTKRFADSGGWGWAAFKYDAASGTFTPATTTDKTPQANDAKCGFGCHTIVKSRDYVFTDYAPGKLRASASKVLGRTTVPRSNR